MDYAAIIKERVSTPELFSYYGFDRDWRGLVCCMFHHDTRASMKVYDGAAGYHCFSCQAHGDVINFVQQYFALPFRDALSKINNDFHLGLPINTSVDAEKRRQMRREAEERRERREAIRKEHDRLYKAYDDALAEWIRLDRQRMDFAPKTLSEPFGGLYVEALQNIDNAAYILDSAAEDLYQFEHRKK